MAANTVRKPVIFIITGQTGTGKTALSLEVARRLSVEIISADSRQVYRGMDIGTDKVALEGRRSVPHHLIDVAAPEEVFTAADFKRQAEASIKAILRRGRRPLVCGGTGLYLQALEKGLFLGPGRDDELRQRLRERLQTQGPAALHRELACVDAAAASRIHPRDTVRVIRALEVFHLTGEPISSHQEKKTRPSVYRFRKASLYMKDKVAYRARLEARVDRMIGRGLVEEVQGLLDAGYQPRLPALQTPGYREIAAALAGKMSLKEAIARTKTATWRYAKRQQNWLRRDEALSWYAVEEQPDCGRLAEAVLGEWEEMEDHG